MLEISDFEKSFINVLSEAKALEMLNQGLSNMLVHAGGTDEARILNLQRYARKDRGTSHFYEMADTQQPVM